MDDGDFEVRRFEVIVLDIMDVTSMFIVAGARWKPRSSSKMDMS